MSLKILNVSLKEAQMIHNKFIGRAKGFYYINKEGKKYSSDYYDSIAMAISTLINAFRFDYIRTEQILIYENYNNE